MNIANSDIAANVKDEILKNGAWRSHSIYLGNDVYTQEYGKYTGSHIGLVQLISDYYPQGLSGVKVLDLGAGEGAYSIDLALLGCSVTAIEARGEHVKKIQFVKDLLKINTLTVMQKDVRDIDSTATQMYDIVLCCGLIYHLPVAEIVKLFKTIHAIANNMLIVSSWTSAVAKTARRVENNIYYGRELSQVNKNGKNSAIRFNAIHEEKTFIPTHASICNMLIHSGFTSITEKMAPLYQKSNNQNDVRMYIAKKGVQIKRFDNTEYPIEQMYYKERVDKMRVMLSLIYSLMKRIYKRLRSKKS